MNSILWLGDYIEYVGSILETTLINAVGQEIELFSLLAVFLCVLSGVLHCYYIQINKIQENIDEITCISQKVLFSLVKNIKSVISLVKNITFWSFLFNSTVSLQNFKRL